MGDGTGTTGEFDRARVGRAARMVVEAVHGKRAREREAAVEAARTGRRFFGLVGFTRTPEEAEREVASLEASFYGRPGEFRGSGAKGAALRLVALSEHAEGTTLRLSGEDLALVLPFWAAAEAKGGDAGDAGDGRAPA